MENNIANWGYDDVWRIVWMTLIFCFLMPLSRSAWALKKNFSLAMWLHIVSAPTIDESAPTSDESSTTLYAHVATSFPASPAFFRFGSICSGEAEVKDLSHALLAIPYSQLI